MTEIKKFPKDFYWGAATASYQVEGGIENCDWAEAAQAGKVPVCGLACDHYNRFEADFDIARELGHNAHRFSIEWARIEPREGEFDETELAHYVQVLRALRARNLEPFVTLWHFTLPLWFSQSGGFERRDSPEIFARYCARVIEALKEDCVHIATMNEPNVFATQGWINGEWPPFKMSAKPWQRSYTGVAIKKRAKLLSVLNYFKVMANLAAAHIAAAKAIKAVHPRANVSVVKHIHVYLPPSSFFNKIRAALSDYYQNHRFTRKIIHHLDEIGLNYYQASQFGTVLTDRKTDMGWNFTPDNIYDALRLLARYHKPIYISEAGIADADDSDRSEYIEKQLAGTARAIYEGIDVRGHMYWSLLDNYEWVQGFERKFGLVAVDITTQERKIRPSAWRYKELIEQYSSGTVSE